VAGGVSEYCVLQRQRQRLGAGSWELGAGRSARPAARNIGHRSPPGSMGELGRAVCAPGGPTWALGRWALGSVAGDPAPRRAPGLAHLVLLRAGDCRPGAEAARVLGSWALATAPSAGFGNGISNGAAPHCRHCVYPDRLKLPSSSHFYNLARSRADPDWRSSVNQCRGSPFRHTDCTIQ
jgi:hypothetical protein